EQFDAGQLFADTIGRQNRPANVFREHFGNGAFSGTDATHDHHGGRFVAKQRIPGRKLKGVWANRMLVRCRSALVRSSHAFWRVYSLPKRMKGGVISGNRRNVRAFEGFGEALNEMPAQIIPAG